MGFWSRFFKEPEGLRIEGEYIWEISNPEDHINVLRQIFELFPIGHILYLEGMDKHIYVNQLASKESNYKAPIAQGTMWPKPHIAHIPLNTANIEYIIHILENEGYVEQQVFVHLHVYHDNKVVLQWHDAADDPIILSEELDENRVEAFCKNIGSTYKKIEQKKA